MRSFIRVLGGVLLWAAVLGGAVPAWAQTADLDQRVREIASSLRCPVCENLSVADSPAPLAAEMRAVIREKLVAGESTAAITQYFVERYGEGILLNPPQQGFSLLIWLGAVAAVLAGAGLLTMRVRRALRPNRVPGPAADPPLDTEEQQHYEAVLDAALAEYTGGDPRC